MKIYDLRTSGTNGLIEYTSTNGITGSIVSGDYLDATKFHTTLISGQSTYTVTHSLNDYYLSTDVWVAGTNGMPIEKIYPQIVIVDENNINVNFSSETTVDTILVCKK